jgi:hypothetical protein
MLYMYVFAYYKLILECRRGRNRVVIGFTTTYAISVYHH